MVAQCASAVLAGCGGGTTTASTIGLTGRTPAGAPAAGARAGEATARSGGLTVRLVLAPTRVARGSVVRIEIVARAQNARGALGYLAYYGDASKSGSGAVPQFCLSEAHRPTSQTWRLTHRYGRSGKHVVSVSVYINCTHERAVVMAPLLVS